MFASSEAPTPTLVSRLTPASPNLGRMLILAPRKRLLPRDVAVWILLRYPLLSQSTWIRTCVPSQLAGFLKPGHDSSNQPGISESTLNVLPSSHSRNRLRWLASPHSVQNGLPT